jgi:hypothetical protein
MGLFDSLRKRSSVMQGRKDSTDALRDNLYLLLNRDKIQKFSMIRFVVPDMETPAGGDNRRIFREQEKMHVAP